MGTEFSDVLFGTPKPIDIIVTMAQQPTTTPRTVRIVLDFLRVRFCRHIFIMSKIFMARHH